MRTSQHITHDLQTVACKRECHCLRAVMQEGWSERVYRRQGVLHAWYVLCVRSNDAVVPCLCLFHMHHFENRVVHHSVSCSARDKGEYHDNHIYIGGDGHKTGMVSDVCGIQCFQALGPVGRAKTEWYKFIFFISTYWCDQFVALPKPIIKTKQFRFHAISQYIIETNKAG